MNCNGFHPEDLPRVLYFLGATGPTGPTCRLYKSSN